MNNLTSVALFAGGGGKTLGSMAAGFQPVGAVEWNGNPKIGGPDAIAAVYAENVSPRVTVAKVEEAAPEPFQGIDLLMASPVCTRASVANANRGESDVDMTAAIGACRWLRVTRPKLFVMENVTQYRAFRSCRLIEECLNELGYFFTADNVNAADYGVPQTRRRLILRAVRDGLVPPLPRPVTRWTGWYEAIEDLLPGLPESRFAPWQLALLDPQRMTALIEGDAAGKRHPTCRTSEEPCFTIKTASGGRVARAFLIENQNTLTASQCGRRQANMPTAFLTDGRNTSRAATVRDSHSRAMTITADVFRRPSSDPQAFIVDGKPANFAGDLQITTSGNPVATGTASEFKHNKRAWLDQGRVVAMNIHALSRFQSFPDSYKWPDKRSLAATICGNAMPPLLAEVIIKGLKDAL